MQKHHIFLYPKGFRCGGNSVVLFVFFCHTSCTIYTYDEILFWHSNASLSYILNFTSSLTLSWVSLVRSLFAFKEFIVLNLSYNGNNYFLCIMHIYDFIYYGEAYIARCFYLFYLYNFYMSNTIKWLVQALWVGNFAKIE